MDADGANWMGAATGNGTAGSGGGSSPGCRWYSKSVYFKGCGELNGWWRHLEECASALALVTLLGQMRLRVVLQLAHEVEGLATFVASVWLQEEWG